MDTLEISEHSYIVGLGNPIIDISATANEETVKKFGLEFGGTVFANDSNIGFYDLIESQSDVQYIPGGSVTNSIRITNWLLNNSKIHKCLLLGCIGNDNYGKLISEELEKSKVKPLLEVRDDMKSSRCAVAIHLKERCLVPQIRASTMLSLDFVNKNMSVILNSNLLLIEGYFVMERFDIVQLLVKEFQTINKKIAFTLSATFMVESFADRMLEVSNSASLIFCNDDEARSFSKNKSENIEEVAESLHRILAPLDRILVITCGSKPVVVSRYDYKLGSIDFIIKSIVHKVPEEEIVDTNGCGDSYVGGFLSQYIQGKSLEACARAGNWASSVIIRNVGCTYPTGLSPEIFI